MKLTSTYCSLLGCCAMKSCVCTPTFQMLHIHVKRQNITTKTTRHSNPQNHNLNTPP
jgi:hypothetical protein